MKVLPIDNGFCIISVQAARKLCGGSLPSAGYEKLVKGAVPGQHWWVTETIYQGKRRWSFRDAGGWYLDEFGRARLGGR